MHDVFHVSQLRTYVLDPAHVLGNQPIVLKENLTYESTPVQILDFKTKQLRNKVIPLVKVLWQDVTSQEMTWEKEDEMRQRYPELFTGMNFGDKISFKGGRM